MRLKMSFGLLLVLIFSLSMISGIVRSAPVPTILVSNNANGVAVQGSSWTANTAVILYFDVVDANHKVAQPTTDYVGSFMANFPLGGTTQGTHTVTAVQGAKQATAAFAVGAVSPPDDRLLNPINSILSLMQTGVSSDLQQIKTKLNTVDGEIQAVENKLDAGGSFYNFVGNWFNTINGKLNSANTELNNVENKIDSVKTQVDAVKAEQVIYNGSGYAWTRLSDGMFGIVTITTNKICKYTIYYYAYWEDKDDSEDLDVRIDGGWIRDIPMGHIEAGISTKLGDKALTLAADGIHLHGYNEDGRTDISWAVVVEGSPGTLVNVTWE